MRVRNSEREGFSLIELVIVIAILAILTGGIALSYNLVRSADTKGTAYDIDSNLTNFKSRSMGSNKQIYMHLYRYSGDIYVDYTEEESYTPAGAGEMIGDSEVTVSCDATVMADGSVTTIAIQKKDGAFVKGPKEIKVSDGDSSSYVVYLIKDTGKHYVEEK
ncbi:MAG: prepilin-type N-terminal cleavage/methylation domain-containing protein [Eubacterium sp.]|nr:prepilin-type N-terminal cleavage/methylation domain-containing protein [Eubacterium sp.]